MVRHADHAEPPLARGMGDIISGPSVFIVINRHRLREADPVLAQVGLRLLRIPGFAHPGDRSHGASSDPHRALTPRLTPNLSQRVRRVGAA